MWQKRRSTNQPSPKIVVAQPLTYDDVAVVALSSYTPEESYENMTVLSAPQDSETRRKSLMDMIVSLFTL